jgi:ribosome modulation factor
MPTESSQEAWEHGFAAGLLGDNECPYFAGTDEALTWLSGWIEGERIRLVQLERHTHKKTSLSLGLLVADCPHFFGNGFA